MTLLVLQNDNQLDIDCKNADGLTALLLVTRDAALFEKLGSIIGKQIRPVETVKELLSKGAYVLRMQRTNSNICSINVTVILMSVLKVVFR